MSMNDSSEVRSWYAVQVRPNYEKITATLLRYKGYEEFTPLQKVKRRWSDRTKIVEMPLFPGYLFCRCTGETCARIVVTPGVLRLVGAGRTPLPVADEEIGNIRRIVSSNLCAEPWPFLPAGEKIEILDGPLRGLQGVLVRARNADRVVASVALLQRSIAVEISRDWIAPVSSWRATAPGCAAAAI